MPRLLLVCDIDGTLVGRDGRWPTGELDVLPSVAESFGVTLEFWLATSRPPSDCETFIRQGPDWVRSAVAVCFDGGLTVRIERESATIEAERVMHPTGVAEALTYFRQQLLRTGEVLVFGAGETRRRVLSYSCGSRQSHFARLCESLGDSREPVAVSSWDALVERAAACDVRGVSWFGPLQRRAEAGARPPGSLTCLAYPELRLDHYQGFHWIDLVMHGTSKGEAVARALESRAPTFVVALVNGLNDLDLVRLARHSFCPNDADPAVRRCATNTLDAPGGAPFVAAFAPALHRLLAQAPLSDAEAADHGDAHVAATISHVQDGRPVV